MAPAKQIPPQWLATQTASTRKAVLRILKQRESNRAAIRALYLEGRNPPPEIPRPVFDYYSIAAACLPDNEAMNRYRDIKPYDRTRIVVGSEERYLNADWVQERYGHKWWIASQAPMPETAHAYLSLIRKPIALPLSTARTRVRTVVQLTNLIEGGRRKAHSYFPTSVGQSIAHSAEPGYAGKPMTATLIDSVSIPHACCVKSTVLISLVGSGEKPVTFQHLLFTAWPDHGVPEAKEQQGLLEFIRLAENTNRKTDDPDPDPPIIVGCSAGIGRTGTFIALCSLLRAHGFLSAAPSVAPLTISSPLGPLPAPASDDLVGQEVDWLREQRPGMVQQDSQANLIYSMLEAAFVR